MNTLSILFATKYFFIKIPSIMEEIEISDSFLNKYSITDREKEVIGFLLSGAFIKQITDKLDRSFKIINNHIYNIYKKTGVDNKLELLILVKENKI
jgi:DNA-binding NarL/FixJ family response regulator